MTDQLDLFTAVARHTDPPTSHEAAGSMTPLVLGAQCQKVLAALAHCQTYSGVPGGTAYEIVLAMSVLHARAIQQSVCARRLRDLADLGLVEDRGVTRPGSSGRPGIAWFLTDAGWKAAGR